MTEKNETDLLFDILQNGGTVMDVPTDAEGNPDGEAFCKSLAEAIASIPPVWVRKKDDSEWSTPKWLGVNQVTGTLANGIAQACLADSEVPEDMTGLLRFIRYEIRTNWPGKVIGGDETPIFEGSLCRVGAFLWDRCNEHPGFKTSAFDQEAAVHNALICLRTELREEDRFEARFAAKMEAESVAASRGEGDGI